MGAATAYPRPYPLPYPQAPPPEGPLAFPRPGANGDYAAGKVTQYNDDFYARAILTVESFSQQKTKNNKIFCILNLFTAVAQFYKCINCAMSSNVFEFRLNVWSRSVFEEAFFVRFGIDKWDLSELHILMLSKSRNFQGKHENPTYHDAS